MSKIKEPFDWFHDDYLIFDDFVDVRISGAYGELKKGSDFYNCLKAYHEYVMEQKIEELDKLLRLELNILYGGDRTDEKYYDGIRKSIEIIRGNEQD